HPPQFQAEVTPYLKQAPKLNGAWVFTDDSHRSVYDSQRLTLMPRLGVAIRINDKAAFRAGYARYVIPPLLTQSTMDATTVQMWGFSAQTSVAPPLQGVPGARISDPFPSSNPLIL